MQIKVKLFATLQKGRFDEKMFNLVDNTTVRDVLHIIGVDEKDASIIFINNRHQTLDTVLKDGDILSIFPSIGGG
ncbi:MAG: MoaD/ThiS family protein [Thermodesulfovibrionales bacterium]|nr:MoaD/ThiS family protein [Thermodesulfovibrionales bacterium]